MTAAITNRRSGFTLVELLVVCAICVIIMAVMASIFGSGTEAVRQVRSAGEMMDQLRAAGEVMKLDMQGSTHQNLRVAHFAPNPIPGQSNDRLRLSDYTFHTGTTAPSGGFFRILSPPTTIEGVDADFIQSGRAGNHLLHFTTRTNGGSEQNHYSATVNGLTYTSTAVEIAYFLVPDTGRFTNGPGTVQLFKLIRRQRLIATTPHEMATFQSLFSLSPTPPNAATLDPAGTASEVISVRLNLPPQPAPQPVWLVNAMTDVTNPANRLGGSSAPNLPYPPGNVGFAPLTGARAGDDVLLSNVISFEVKPTWDAGTGVRSPRSYPSGVTGYATSGTDDPNLPSTTPPYTYPNSTDAPFDNLATALPTPGPTYANFDTGSSPTIRVKGTQIRIRVFDAKLKNARQSCFVIDL